MHELVRPKTLIPMHGEHRHLRQHARLGAARGMNTAIAPNGTMLDITGDEPIVAEYIDTGRLYLDGTAIYGAMDGVVRERMKLALNGHVMVTLIIDEDGLPMGEAWADCLGLAREGRARRPLAEIIEEELVGELERTGRKILASDDRLTETIKRRVRHVCVNEIGKKPEVTIVISRLSDE